MPAQLITLDEVDSFREVRSFPASAIIPALVAVVRELNEPNELEPYLRATLADVGVTPHGPAELVDIFTHKVTLRREPVLAAFILKGRSFRTVRPQDVSHQIYRLEKIDGLQLAVFAYTGTVLDAAKEQFVSTARRIDCGYMLLDAVDIARLLVAYGFLCPRDARKISAGRCTCGYSPSHRILTALQDEAIAELRRARSLGQPAGLVVLPPGCGKTRLAAEDAYAAQAKHVLYVAHSQEILDVAESEFNAVFGVDLVRRHSSRNSLRTIARANIATIQLLNRHLRHLRSDEFDYLIVDEFHHAAAPSYRRLLDRIRPRFLLGLTATPFRADRQDILALCNNNVILEVELRGAIEAGLLTPYHYFGCFDNIDYTRIRHNGARYDIRDLERALVVPERDAAIIAEWIRIGDYRPTLAFCCSHRHAQRFSRQLNQRGISAAVYLSDTPRTERTRLVARHSAGELKVLCVVDVLNEGADLPHVECLLFLRPTDSKRIFFQQLGRGLRRYVGKSQCIVIDFIGNFKNAYRIPEYQGLRPMEEDPGTLIGTPRTFREVLDLPAGCRVTFDSRVIELFEQQVADPRFATRRNIARILIHQFERLERRLGREATKRDVDRGCLLGSHLYALVFGSWKAFEDVRRRTVGGA
jgi:superfamily II DNA or RNA helicase